MDKFQPDGRPTVIPRIFTQDVVGLVEFLRSVFHARGECRTGAPSEMKIGDSIVMVSDGGGVREALSACLYVYVENTDKTYQRAMDLGAVSIDRPMNMPWGDRRATIQDSWGNMWQIATHNGASTSE
jgi:uncharacterized glyoxalase superfamily protein PhnB